MASLQLVMFLAPSEYCSNVAMFPYSSNKFDEYHVIITDINYENKTPVVITHNYPLRKHPILTSGSHTAYVTVPKADMFSALKLHLSFLPAHDDPWSPLPPLSISGVVIQTAKCRHHCRNKLTPFHHVRVQPSEKPTCPLRQIETDSERKRCSDVIML